MVAITNFNNFVSFYADCTNISDPFSFRPPTLFFLSIIPPPFSLSSSSNTFMQKALAESQFPNKNPLHGTVYLPI